MPQPCSPQSTAQLQLPPLCQQSPWCISSTALPPLRAGTGRASANARGRAPSRCVADTLRDLFRPAEGAEWTLTSSRLQLQDPLALMGIVAILFPFIFLGIAIAFGLVDLSGGR